MTSIWTQNGIVENDPWVHTQPDADHFEDNSNGHKLLPLADALEHALDNAPFGVVLQPGEDAYALAPIVGQVSIIALNFPAFSDGRAFSQATLLRERLGYRGELRAIGNVLLDQIPLMLRVGFSSFAVTHEPTLQRLVENRLPGINLHYQPAVDETKAGQAYSWRRSACV